MKTVLAFGCSVATLLFLPACGGDAPKTAPAAPPAAQPSQPATTSVPGNVPAAPGQNAPAPAAQDQKPAAKKPAPPVRLDAVMTKALFGNEPTSPQPPAAATPEQVALGRVLFHEAAVSKGGRTSCASCHDLANYGQDGKKSSPRADGTEGKRNTPTVWNAARQFAQFWDSRAESVEQAVLAHATAELGFADAKEVEAAIAGKPELVAAFDKAFPGGTAVSVQNWQQALGAFLRTLVTKSKWDAWLAGDTKALSNEEKLGCKTFIEAGCIACHMTTLFGGAMNQKLGVHKPYPSDDVGRAALSGADSDKFFFKVPLLLNVEKTAPYNHDGRFATLEDAVNNMADVQLNRQLKPEETAAIVTFLKALTGPLPEQK